MLFNSIEFIFIFLPLMVVGYYLLKRFLLHETAIGWLVLGSLFFYGWWEIKYLLLITSSVLLNYGIGCGLAYGRNPRRRKALLVLGISLNIIFLAYFKYANFFVDNVNNLANLKLDIGSILLPLAISFFTFQQIAYLVDCERGLADEHSLLHYALFVTFFPQLIAGPIVHHKEMLPQFLTAKADGRPWTDLVVGSTIFTIGLFKKVVIADHMALHSSLMHSVSDSGVAVGLVDSWIGALAYTFQIYFDFSGYTDMAIGAARLFGIRLPLNFDSPYKASSIIEFWSRWHMTLSRFLRDYLYIPLGGGRRGEPRRYLNVFVTMLLGGLWHGAGWTFLLWGGIHGLLIVGNHAYRGLMAKIRSTRGRPAQTLLIWVSRFCTFLAIVVTWVFFRADSASSAWSVVKGMAGANGLTGPTAIFAGNSVPLFLGEIGLGPYGYLAAALGFALAFVWLAPNTQELMGRYRPALNPARVGALAWRPTTFWCISISFILLVALARLTDVSEFIYFQF